VPLLLIGASTGGTQAIEEILVSLPESMPPVAIAQHIPAGFSRAFADRLDRVCALEVREAEHGEPLRPGVALVAPGNRHLTIEPAGRDKWVARLSDGEKVCYQRPSVDVLMQSGAAAAGSRAIGVILTGMGQDGAQGLLAMKRAGAVTIAQDEESCVVFGMPREAILRGAAGRVLPLHQIGPALVGLTQGRSSRSQEASVAALAEKGRELA
jgi:two-component system chemotaxis response regulator CheB